MGKNDHLERFNLACSCLFHISDPCLSHQPNGHTRTHHADGIKYSPSLIPFPAAPLLLLLPSVIFLQASLEGLFNKLQIALPYVFIGLQDTLCDWSKG
ncbi:unnamed protein product [Citrullus colocynthis]|uniref:Uncharacterized protein n=1 Tax=Citrullus colocynthis TaxID=252529 RepID=A0ABP0Z2Y7_9ROSI